MAFTTSADHKLTATDIITEALELLGVLAEGEAPSTNQSTSALRSLNNIIKLWSADAIIFAQDEYTLDLVASTGQYALGVGNVGYIPNKILNASLINSSDSTEIPLSPLTQEEWYALTDKTTEGQPTQYYQKRQPVGVSTDLYLWPVPSDTTYDLKLWLQYPFRDVDAGTDDVWFTQEWYIALAFELAYVLSNKYGVNLRERVLLKETADNYFGIASSYDTDGSMYLQPDSKHG
jgi:hypothetical protein